jgi:hypothetical protein
MFLERGNASGLFGIAGAKKEARSSKQGKRRRGFKPEAAAGFNRNATTSACVGWDKDNIENQSAFRKLRWLAWSPANMV